MQPNSGFHKGGLSNKIACAMVAVDTAEIPLAKVFLYEVLQGTTKSKEELNQWVDLAWTASKAMDTKIWHPRDLEPMDLESVQLSRDDAYSSEPSGFFHAMVCAMVSVETLNLPIARISIYELLKQATESNEEVSYWMELVRYVRESIKAEVLDARDLAYGDLTHLKLISDKIKACGVSLVEGDIGRDYQLDQRVKAWAENVWEESTRFSKEMASRPTPMVPEPGENARPRSIQVKVTNQKPIKVANSKPDETQTVKPARGTTKAPGGSKRSLPVEGAPTVLLPATPIPAAGMKRKREQSDGGNDREASPDGHVSGEDDRDHAFDAETHNRVKEWVKGVQETKRVKL
ncbi:hypothetical protein BV22DRAFT_1195674 [Leucogyrophana mollusca]|uniref:Uncharacterized protein n=1 Tax=Leucogyrophana mollusca TaxID=85980 RepID=A0ACB8BHF8_9AGAM|nr:hypothetical protein BV22DRAFT_1195674 [Leucogyrophana mollusca]